MDIPATPPASTRDNKMKYLATTQRNRKLTINHGA